MPLKSSRRRSRTTLQRAKPASMPDPPAAPSPVPSSRDEAFRLYDFAPAMYVILDGSGLIVDINQTGCRMLGRSHHTLPGLPLRMWMAGESRAEFLEHLRRCRAGEEVVESEVRIRAADGGFFPARLYSKRSEYRRRKVFATVIVDLSEYVSLEKARLAAERQRDQAERDRELALAGEAAKDRLIASVSHELRNPLSPALVAAEVLASWMELPDRARNLASVVKRNIELEARLIDDLLDVARASRGKLQLQLQPVDIHQVLLDAVNGCTPDRNAKSITLSLDLQARAHHARADDDRLRQVFANLFNNAIKFSDPGGAIIVRTANDHDDTLRISIRDQGAGMDADTIANLFRPFGQRPHAAGRRGGLGLGLSISNSIVEGHGGRMWASSHGVGFGSTFEIELATCPSVAEDPRPVALREATPVADGQGPGANGRSRVLVVEDHPDTGTLLSMFLVQQGYDVTLAQTLEDGIAQLERGWDVVLTDIGLVDGSGLDLAAKARSLAGPQPRMIALSGYGSKTDVAASLEAGFDDHLVKPVELQKLLEALAGVPVSK
jgi:PAS domain S-box-containing protein